MKLCHYWNAPSGMRVRGESFFVHNFVNRNLSAPAPTFFKSKISRKFTFSNNLQKIKHREFEIKRNIRDRGEVELKGAMLYRDGGHLSYDGSRLLGVEMAWGKRILAEGL